MMNRYLSILLIAGATLWSTQASAQADTPAKPKVAKKATIQKKAIAKKPEPAAQADASHDEDDDGIPDTASSTVTEFKCELGNNITLYQNPGNDRHIALRWKKMLHRLTRVGTTTGANRFENRKFGLVWIGIPTKSMLLDSKKGLQLANECRSAEQLVPQQILTPEPSVLQEQSKG